MGVEGNMPPREWCEAKTQFAIRRLAEDWENLATTVLAFVLLSHQSRSQSDASRASCLLSQALNIYV